MDEPSKIKSEHRENLSIIFAQQTARKMCYTQINVVGDMIDRSSCMLFRSLPGWKILH